MRVGIGQIDPFVGDMPGNACQILDQIDKARGAGCRLAVFSELAISGPAPLGLVRRTGFVEQCDAAVEAIRERCDGIAVIVGTVVRTRVDGAERLIDGAVVIDDGLVIARIGAAAPADESTDGFPPNAGLETVTIDDLTVGVTLGAELDEDAVGALAALGADWAVHLAASPFHTGVQAERLANAERAAEFGLGILYVNCVGGQVGSVFDGGSFAVGPNRRLLVLAPRFEPGLSTFDLETEATATAPVEDPVDEIRSAIALGIRDYVRKAGFERVVVGMSGGIDSALVTCLAVEALGADAVIGTFIPCACSSEQSRADALAIASNLGIEFIEIPAEGVHEALRTALPFDARSIVDENLQARARAVLWMALANERDALVLAAGNKSEAAVGYATLYGDTTGALAPIADLYKEDVYQLAEMFGEQIPRSVIDKAPSAELRPDHRDDDDLPPYPLLDRLLRALIDENASRSELIERGFDAELVDDILRRFYAAEFKRRQTPPGIAVSRTPLGRTRLPLIHGFRA